jgi:hypothetical protein
MRLADIRFTRTEARRFLPISELPDHPTAADLEAFLRDGLLRLYQTVAERQLVVELPEVSVAEPAGETPREEVASPFEDVREMPAKRQRGELRRAPRYQAAKTLTGTYRDVGFTILELSATGLRIRHDDTLRAGDEARVTFGIPPSSYTVRARVAWTTIAQHEEGPSFCMSGLQVTANIDHLQKALEHLRKTDSGSKRAAAALRTPPALVGLSDDDVASIIRAYRRFSADPVEAGKWYSRARFSVIDDSVRSVAPERPRDREEVLGIWEYLERRVAIDAVINVVGWLRQTKSAAAV